jgi:hypothetical protein
VGQTGASRQSKSRGQPQRFRRVSNLATSSSQAEASAAACVRGAFTGLNSDMMRTVSVIAIALSL